MRISMISSVSLLLVSCGPVNESVVTIKDRALAGGESSNAPVSSAPELSEPSPQSEEEAAVLSSQRLSRLQSQRRSSSVAFSVLLARVSHSAVAGNFPSLNFRAAVSHCADATSVLTQSKQTPLQTPVAWYMCGNENNPEVSNSEALAHHESLRARGVPTEYVAHPATPLYDERFARIPQVTVEKSKAIAAELKAAGFVDEKNFLSRSSEQLNEVAALPANAAMFTNLLSLSGEALLAVRGQIDVMRAEHSMYSDYSSKAGDFFERFVLSSFAASTL